MDKSIDAFMKNAGPWRDVVTALREALEDTGLAQALTEEVKWGKPCYVHDGRNIAIIQPFKACVGLMFFKGMLLEDPQGLLVDNGPHSQSARRLEFRSVDEVVKRKAALRRFVNEALRVEAAGTEVVPSTRSEPLPAELLEAFRRKPAFKKAFEALTPGRQRGYVLHFSAAKQAATRASRIATCVPLVLAGKGLRDA